MPTRKRSRKGGKSVSQEDDSENLQGGASGLDQLIAWLEDFDMQCNFILCGGYKEALMFFNLHFVSQ
jgi:hypothetical protein